MTFEKLPFYWRLKEKNSPNIVPDFRPFQFHFNESLQLIIQKRNKETLDYLEKIYKAESNIGYLQDANEIAKPYGIDFMDFINRSIKIYLPNTKNILEVGCGGCTILSQLKEKGFDVLGVDPSPIAKRDGESKGILIIQEFFPTKKYTKLVDMIFHCDVLEHVSDPVQFLKNQRNQLTENGIIIISLPDCNEGIEKGEISMTMHQHLNYFDTEGLRNTVEAAGLEVLTIEVAKYGGSLYCCARNKNNINYIPKKGTLKIDSFNLLCEKQTKKILTKIQSKLDLQTETIGFYVPLRTLPYLSKLNNFDGFRFFDDTHHWYNRAFDGVEVYIENFNDLKNKPVDNLFIMSLTFGTVIKSKIQNNIQGIKSITTLHEILSENDII
jgi:2-polyprenyl-3-methyl-5-hydroxy-6-metoxy-1,4-benzoquinol methylase